MHVHATHSEKFHRWRAYNASLSYRINKGLIKYWSLNCRDINVSK